MKGFRHALVYVEGEGLQRRNILFDERIADTDASEETEAEWLDLPEDALVLPGFIDLHIHGAAGADLRDDDAFGAIRMMAEYLPSEGVTAFLATEAQQSEKRMISVVSAAEKYREENRKTGARLLGVHLEGPFVNGRYCGGLLPEALQKIQPESVKKYMETPGSAVRLVTLAPETEGAGELIRYLRGRGIVVSLGHTDAKFSDMVEAVRAGATNVTHVFNAQSPLHHREIGAAGGALLLDELYCEVIADTIHVSVPAMKLLVKCKPKDKIILISDAICFKGWKDEGTFMADGKKISVRDGAARMKDGRLAGSILRIDRAIRNMTEKVGVPLLQAVDYASANPAKSLGIYEMMGSIRTGKYADFAVVDSRLSVFYTIRGGEIVYNRCNGSCPPKNKERIYEKTGERN